MPASIPTSSAPLKDRFYLYRGVVLHQKKAAAEGDQKYWDIQNAPPVITSLNPTTIIKNNAFTLGVAGTAFDDKAYVIFGGVGHVTIQSPPTALACKIDAADIANAGNYSVTVHNGNGKVSNAMTFVVTPN